MLEFMARLLGPGIRPQPLPPAVSQPEPMSQLIRPRTLVFFISMPLFPLAIRQMRHLLTLIVVVSKRLTIFRARGSTARTGRDWVRLAPKRRYACGRKLGAWRGSRGSLDGRWQSPERCRSPFRSADRECRDARLLRPRPCGRASGQVRWSTEP